MSEDKVFHAFVTWSGILLIKMLLTACIAGLKRIQTGAFVNPEDLHLTPKGQIKTDETVERWRRAHLNDLENIPVFILAALFYVCFTVPDETLALWLIRSAVIARILHTIVYAVHPVRQPARGICFHVCLWITVYMIGCSMFEYFQL